MRVLIFHGYMLRGTGSNIYNANLAQALARLGHEVHLLCQDREVKLAGVQIHNPDIGGLLPVYVKDPYEGFEVKAFPELSSEELDRYVSANVEAVRAVAEEAGGFDAALANHLIMGPAILARADVAPFAAKIHGSALEYTVKPNPRFLPYAREGMEAASGVLVGSRHTAESLWATLPDLPGLQEKTRLGPPGVDTVEFRPAPERDPLVVFVGKLIVSKGVDLLLAAWPLVHAAHPDARLGSRGSASMRTDCAACSAALEQGDLGDAREVARLGRGLEGGEQEAAADPLGVPGRSALRLCRGGNRGGRVGRVDRSAGARRGGRAASPCGGAGHAQHLPGGVWDGRRRGRRLRSAACLCRSLRHAGGLAAAGRGAAGGGRPLTSFPVKEGAVEAIAERLSAWLELPEERRPAAREALVETVRRLWSWEGVARGVIAAAAGRLGELPAPG